MKIASNTQHSWFPTRHSQMAQPTSQRPLMDRGDAGVVAKKSARHSDPSQRGSSRVEGRLPAAHALGAKVPPRNSSLF